MKLSIWALHGSVCHHVLSQWFEYKIKALVIQLPAKALEFWAQTLEP